jgi:riboflavin kinase/FMN adenylyltransferase
MTPEEFFDAVLVRRLGAKALVEGYDFRFGRGRAGTTAMLRGMCERVGLAFEEVAPFTVGNEPVSSSRVRAALLAGEVAAAAELLGRAYRIAGTVITGARRGRTIGFPTANLADVPTVLPGNGVYAVRATVDGVQYPSAANIGPNPTFGEDARKVEVHLIGFSGDLYGRPLAAEFVAKLRDTRPFAGVNELVEQVRRDVAEAKRILG